jgi:hypothetical protein
MGEPPYPINVAAFVAFTGVSGRDIMSKNASCTA